MRRLLQQAISFPLKDVRFALLQHSFCGQCCKKISWGHEKIHWFHQWCIGNIRNDIICDTTTTRTSTNSSSLISVITAFSVLVFIGSCSSNSTVSSSNRFLANPPKQSFELKDFPQQIDLDSLSHGEYHYLVSPPGDAVLYPSTVKDIQDILPSVLPRSV